MILDAEVFQLLEGSGMTGKYHRIRLAISAMASSNRQACEVVYIGGTVEGEHGEPTSTPPSCSGIGIGSARSGRNLRSVSIMAFPTRTPGPRECLRAQILTPLLTFRS